MAGLGAPLPRLLLAAGCTLAHSTESGILLPCPLPPLQTKSAPTDPSAQSLTILSFERPSGTHFSQWGPMLSLPPLSFPRKGLFNFSYVFMAVLGLLAAGGLSLVEVSGHYSLSHAGFSLW